MRLRRMMIGIATMLGALCWTAVPDVAYAGGPTSVLVVNLSEQRATGLYHSDAGYDRLVAALDAYGTAAGSADRPSSISGNAGETIRLTWLIHDQQIWRIDRIHLTAADGVWVQTVSDLCRCRRPLRSSRGLAPTGRRQGPTRRARRCARVPRTGDLGIRDRCRGVAADQPAGTLDVGPAGRRSRSDRPDPRGRRHPTGPPRPVHPP